MGWVFFTKREISLRVWLVFSDHGKTKDFLSSLSEGTYTERPRTYTAKLTTKKAQRFKLVQSVKLFHQRQCAFSSYLSRSEGWPTITAMYLSSLQLSIQP